MQISKLLSLLSVCSLCLVPLRGHAQDTDAQAKAREALHEKINELQSQPVPATNLPPAPSVRANPTPTPVPPQVPPANPPQTPAPTIKPMPMPPPPSSGRPTPPAQTSAPISKAPPVATQPRSTTTKAMPAPNSPGTGRNYRRVDPEAIARARAALDEKMKELQSQEPQEMENTPPMLSGQPASNPTQQTMPPMLATPAPQSKLRQPPANPPANVAAMPQVDNSRRTQTAPPVVGFQPLQGPASTLSADKHQKLEALLQQYRADQITPEQYHQQRAKILAEP